MHEIAHQIHELNLTVAVVGLCTVCLQILNLFGRNP